MSKLRKLLLALSDAKIREEKTSNPASYSIIGVEDPTLPGAAGAQIEFIAHDGKHAVIVGKPSAEGNFVRRAGENTSYIVEPAISVEARAAILDRHPAARFAGRQNSKHRSETRRRTGLFRARVSVPAPAAAPATAPANAPATAGSAATANSAAPASNFVLTACQRSARRPRVKHWRPRPPLSAA